MICHQLNNCCIETFSSATGVRRVDGDEDVKISSSTSVPFTHIPTVLLFIAAKQALQNILRLRDTIVHIWSNSIQFNEDYKWSHMTGMTRL